MRFSILMACFLWSAWSQASTQELSAKVIELRKEVELLNDEYKTEREKVLNDIKVLSIQKAELASNLRNEEIREKQLLEKMNKLKKEIGESSIESQELRPLIQQTAQSLAVWVEASLPFKQKERLASIQSLQDKMQKNEISVLKAANQLWALIEDEKRLARETSLHRQSIPVDGKMHLAEVVKVGMLFLYFKTDSGQVGMALKDQSGWLYRSFEQTAKQEKTLAFFESLKKQIRQGAFEIPTTI